MNEDLRGFASPFRIDPDTGGIAWSSGMEKLRTNIIHILLTDVGERVMFREYGGGIRQLVHDPNNEALRAIVQHQIAKSIGRWEPGVMLQKVTVTVEQSVLRADLEYVVRHTRQPHSLSVPLFRL